MQEPTIIDVRDATKYQQKHIKGAKNFEHTQILAGQTPGIDKDMPVVLYCGSGNKASKMKDQLEKQGFTSVSSTSLPSLQKKGLPTEPS